MVRDSGISATKPVFPSYLLPNIKITFSRRRSSASSADVPSYPSDEERSPPSTAQTTLSNSPPTKNPTFGKTRKLSRTQHDTLRCGACSADIAFASQIVSKCFTGRHGRAFLVEPLASSKTDSLLNLWIGRNEHRQLATGWHIVADISCGMCSDKLGWKYVDAREMSQKYKIGKFILESERVVTHCTWEDISEDEVAEEYTDAPMSRKQAFKAEKRGRDVDAVASEVNSEAEDADEDEEIEFDSSDDDECEDIFEGVWDAETTRRRRQSYAAKRKALSRSEM